MLLTLFILNCQSTNSTKKNSLPTTRQLTNFEVVSAEDCDPSPNGLGKRNALTGYFVGPLVSDEDKNPTAKILRPFSSDGCSSSPNGMNLTATEKNENPDDNNSWLECCYAHDIQYWTGGTLQDKQKADNRLSECISKKGFPKIAELYRTSVDQFGGPNSTKTYRWGYGWNYQRSFGPLNPKEKEKVKRLNQEGFGPSTLNPRQHQQLIKRTCLDNDPVFAGFSDEENSIYDYLNSHLTKSDEIEWAREGYYNLDYKSYELKLKSCPHAWKFIFEKKSSTGEAITPKVETSCL